MQNSSKIPRVALIGRRNVGKSSLLNALYRKKYAITDELPGLTRDILEVQINNQGYHFSLHDTPGLDVENPQRLEKTIIERAKAYMKQMDLVLFVLAAPTPHSFDLDFLAFIRKNMGKIPLIFVVNKIDNSENADQILLPFYEAKLQDLVPVSALGRWNLDILLSKIGKVLRQTPTCIDTENTKVKQDNRKDNQQDSPKEIKIAIVGRPNVGKSSLFNQILGDDRSLVSEIPGTTRDSIDTLVLHNEEAIRIIDTAGMRRPTRLYKPQHRIDFFSIGRTKRAIKEAQVVIQVIDGLVGLTDFDKKICALAQESKCAVVFAISKWDILRQENKGQEHIALRKIEDRITFLFPHISKLPLIFISSVSGHGVRRLLNTCLDLNQKMNTHISTAELNTNIKKWFEALPLGTRKIKLFYATQVEIRPPSFVFFVNKSTLFLSSLCAYFENCIRKEYGLHGIPIRIHVRERK